MRIRTFALLLPMFLLTACASPKATFQIAVKNDTQEPLSVGLVKVGGGVESGWDGPEHVAMHAPMLADRKWGTLVKPGQVVTIGPQTGTFVAGTHAVLRVYAADASVDELLGFSRRDSGRLDIMLWPGASAYAIDRRDGALHYEPVSPDPAAKE
jgi:hypothetical protein